MPLRPEDLNKLQGLKAQLKAGEAAARVRREAPKAPPQAPEIRPSQRSSEPDSAPLDPTKRRRSRFVDANELFSGEVRPGDEAWDTVRTPLSESRRMADRYHGRYYRKIQGGAHHRG